MSERRGYHAFLAIGVGHSSVLSSLRLLPPARTPPLPSWTGGGAPELVTCGRDGCVRVWDPRVADAVLSLEPKDGESARDCWTVAFGDSFDDDHRALCAGYDNGDVKLFDLRTSSVRWETNVGNGVVCVEFDRKDIEMNKVRGIGRQLHRVRVGGPVAVKTFGCPDFVIPTPFRFTPLTQLVCTTLESKFRVYDMRTHHPEEGYAYLSERAHKSTVWLARHLPQNRDLFATLGGNGGINLYR